MRSRSIQRIILLLVIGAASASVWGDGSTVTPTMALKKSSVYGVAATITATIRMKITTPQGGSERTLKAYVKRGKSSSASFVQIISPAFLSSMKFLSKTAADGRQTRWIGTSRGVRRVATEGSSDEHLFGSDFTVEDLSLIDPQQFQLSLLPKTTIDGRVCYAVQAVPLFRGAGYARKIVYVGSESMLLMGLDYFSGDGTLLRRYRTTSTQRVDGKLFPRTCRMSTPSEKTSTQLIFERVAVGRRIPERIFNIGNM